jgi:hypothetical protein
MAGPKSKKKAAMRESIVSAVAAALAKSAVF